MPDNKISVIVVDDDLSARNTVKNMLRASAFVVTADFADSRKALDWLAKNTANIAICDMNMPQIDGTEFISLAKIVCPGLRFVALSAYSDFRYLRECMVNSVEDYLLKHNLTRERLLSTLENIRNKYAIKPSGLATPGRVMQEEACFKAAHIRGMACAGVINFDMFAVVPLLISPDYNHAAYPDYGLFAINATLAIVDIAAQVLDTAYEYVLYKNAGNQICLLLSFPARGYSIHVAKVMESLCAKIRDRTLRLLNVTLTTASTQETMTLEKALECCANINSLKPLKFYQSPGGSCAVSALAGPPRCGAYELPPYFESQVTIAEGLKNFSMLKDLITNAFAEMTKRRCDRDTVIKTCSRMADILRLDLGESPAQWRHWEFITHFEECVIAAAEARFNASGEKRDENSLLINRVLAYVKEHYREDISLERCAGEAAVSYTHLSRLFSRETGCGFSEYLNRLRVAEAKIYLAEKNIPIKEITGRVGFRNYNYFFKVFKDMEGVTPNEYIELVNRGRPTARGN